MVKSPLKSPKRGKASRQRHGNSAADADDDDDEAGSSTDPARPQLHDLRAILREELASQLSPLQESVQKLQIEHDNLASRLARLESQTPAHSRQSSIEPASQRLRWADAANSGRSTPMSARPSSESLLPQHVPEAVISVNGFPRNTSRTLVVEYIKKLLAEWDFGESTSHWCIGLYPRQCQIRFSTASQGHSFLRKWRAETRKFPGSDSQLYSSWRVSKERARDEFLFRKLATWAAPQLSSMEKDKAQLAIYANKELVARIDKGAIIKASGWTLSMDADAFRAHIKEQEALATRERYRL